MTTARRDDDGMVTAELAVCLPVLMLLLAVALGAVSVAAARIRVADVAREAARLAARGDTAGLNKLESATPGLHVSVQQGSGQVTAVAVARAGLPGTSLPAVAVAATAVAAAEPSVSP